ncbi:hypothetical protein FB451DRAFT_1190745 [Mycena latifolia]|nr:hypothetical protein FB451DRAFT_1190745 [Mycena latifolia]
MQLDKPISSPDICMFIQILAIELRYQNLKRDSSYHSQYFWALDNKFSLRRPFEHMCLAAQVNLSCTRDPRTFGMDHWTFPLSTGYLLPCITPWAPMQVGKGLKINPEGILNLVLGKSGSKIGSNLNRTGPDAGLRFKVQALPVSEPNTRFSVRATRKSQPHLGVRALAVGALVCSCAITYQIPVELVRRPGFP